MDDSSLILNSDETNFCIYGLGSTGTSVVNYFNRKNFTEYRVWDDDEVLRAFYGSKFSKKKGEKLFSKHLDSTGHIIVSPGISLKKAKLRKKLIDRKSVV